MPKPEATESNTHQENNMLIATFMVNEKKVKSMVSAGNTLKQSYGAWIQSNREAADTMKGIFGTSSVTDKDPPAVLVGDKEVEISTNLSTFSVELDRHYAASFSTTLDEAVLNPLNDLLNDDYFVVNEMIIERNAQVTDLEAHQYQLDSLDKKVQEAQGIRLPNGNRGRANGNDIQKRDKWEAKVKADHENLEHINQAIMPRLVTLELRTEEILKTSLNTIVALQEAMTRNVYLKFSAVASGIESTEKNAVTKLFDKNVQHHQNEIIANNIQDDFADRVKNSDGKKSRLKSIVDTIFGRSTKEKKRPDNADCATDDGNVGGNNGEEDSKHAIESIEVDVNVDANGDVLTGKNGEEESKEDGASSVSKMLKSGRGSLVGATELVNRSAQKILNFNRQKHAELRRNRKGTEGSSEASLKTMEDTQHATDISRRPSVGNTDVTKDSPNKFSVTNPPSAQTKKESRLLIVFKDYPTNTPGELRLFKGDTILLKGEQTDNFWGFGSCNGSEGKFPLSFTKKPDIFI
jgi:hypothetical protein